jgi:hypothetical protein
MRTRLTLLAIAVVGSGCGGDSGGPTSNGTAALSLSPPSYVYPNLEIGTTSAPYVFTVTNTGTAASGSLSYGVNGTNSGDFQFAAGTCTSAPLAAGAGCTIGVVLVPQVRGYKAAALMVNATPGGSRSSDISGTALAPAHFLLPTTVVWGNVPLGTAALETITVTNDGDETSGNFTPSLQGPYAALFRIAGSGCFGPLAPGASCDYSVAFAPTTTDLRTAMFVLDIAGQVAVATTELQGAGR